MGNELLWNGVKCLKIIVPILRLLGGFPYGNDLDFHYFFSALNVIAILLVCAVSWEYFIAKVQFTFVYNSSLYNIKFVLISGSALWCALKVHGQRTGLQRVCQGLEKIDNVFHALNINHKVNLRTDITVFSVSFGLLITVSILEIVLLKKTIISLVFYFQIFLTHLSVYKFIFIMSQCGNYLDNILTFSESEFKAKADVAFNKYLITIHYMICCLSKDATNNFSPLILITVLETWLISTLDTYLLIDHLVSEDEVSNWALITVALSLWILHRCFLFWHIIYVCHRAQKKIQAFEFNTCNIISWNSVLNKSTAYKDFIGTEYCIKPRIVYDVYEAFNLDMAFLQMMVGASTGYLVILFQLVE